MAPHIRSYRALCSCFPEKVSLQLSSEQSVGDVRISQLDWKSFTGEVPQLRTFCRHNCWVFAAPRKSKRQLTAESAERCWTRYCSRRPSREAPVWTATGEPGMPLWTWLDLGWVANGVHVIPARYDHCVMWHSAQTAARRAANCSNPTGRK